MAKEKEDIFEVKPGIYGLNINLLALWRLLSSKKEPDDVLIVPNRVFQIFKDHNLAVSQIPRLIPQLSLAQVSSSESLLHALTPEIIQQIADLFQIQRKWLEGTTDVIYDCKYYCYKNPWKFFEDLKTLKIEKFDFLMVAFTTASNFDNQSNRDQPVLLVQREKCAVLDDKVIYRYRIVDQFLWGYFKTRIQLKAMMHIWYKKYEIPVNIYQVKFNILEKMEVGKIVPHSYLRNSKRLHNVGLEDFALSLEYDKVAKEIDEFSEVMKYIKANKLMDIDVKNPQTSEDTVMYR